LSPDLAAGIRRVKGARRLGVRIGNWLTAEEGRRLVGAFGVSTPKERRNRAMIAVLIGCGLRRAEAAALKLEDVQLREGHWVIADLNGKGGHIRTVPMPRWVKTQSTNGQCLLHSLQAHCSEPSTRRAGRGEMDSRRR
jgi:integrase